MVPVLDALKLRTLDHSTSVQTLGVVLGAVVKEYKDHEQNVYGNTQSNKSGSNPFNVMRTSCVVAAADGCGGGGTTVNRPKGPWDDISERRAAITTNSSIMRIRMTDEKIYKSFNN